MICKINKNSNHDGTSAFIRYIFFEKGPHLNAVEQKMSNLGGISLVSS